MPWKEHIEVFRVAIPNMMGKMFPYEFMEQLMKFYSHRTLRGVL